MSSEWIGRTLSKVEIERLISRGGMAEVYLGRHTTLERPVAVKILHAHLSEIDTLQVRFKDEAQSVAALSHPNIVQVFDFDVADDRPYIVMELIDGVTLDEYLQAQRDAGRIMPPAAVARIVESLAAALNYAHAEGIVHRDIKPSNVMLRRRSGTLDPSAPLPPDAEPVLADFGVARLTNVAGRTASGDVIGTPAYMSPEQVRGERVDARSDIYSLGVMVYEMLAGQSPFESETSTPASILVKHITEAPPPLPGASPELQAALDRALAKDREERYQKASELATALNVALGLIEPRSVPQFDLQDPTATLPAQAPPVQPEAAPRTGGTNPIWIVGGVLALAVVVGGLALAGVFGGGGGTTPEDAEPVEAAEVEPGAEEPVDAPADSAPEEEGPAPEVVNTASSHGIALFRDDTLNVALSDIAPPPEGSVYEAWLTAPDADPVSLGVADVSGGELVFDFTDPSGANLAGQFDGFVLSVEPEADDDPAISGRIAYQGQIPEETLARVRLLDDVSRGEPLASALLSGLPQQANTYVSHQGFALDGINGGDLAGAKQHSEHTINVIEGRESADYADWDDNGRVENPGDEVGLLPYLLILSDAVRASAAAPNATTETTTLAGEIGSTVDVLIALTEDASSLAKRVAAADTIEEMQPLVSDINDIRDQIGDVTAQVAQDAGALDLAIGAEVFAVAP